MGSAKPQSLPSPESPAHAAHAATPSYFPALPVKAPDENPEADAGADNYCNYDEDLTAKG